MKPKNWNKINRAIKNNGTTTKTKYTRHYDSERVGKMVEQRKYFFKNFKLCWNLVKIINLQIREAQQNIKHKKYEETYITTHHN